MRAKHNLKCVRLAVASLALAASGGIFAGSAIADQSGDSSVAWLVDLAAQSVNLGSDKAYVFVVMQDSGAAGDIVASVNGRDSESAEISWQSQSGTLSPSTSGGTTVFTAELSGSGAESAAEWHIRLDCRAAGAGATVTSAYVVQRGSTGAAWIGQASIDAGGAACGGDVITVPISAGGL